MKASRQNAIFKFEQKIMLLAQVWKAAGKHARFVRVSLGFCLGSGCVFPPSEFAAEPASNADAQATALLAQMTLEEKIGQMTQADSEALKDKSDVQKYFLGSVLSGGGHSPAEFDANGWLKSCNEFQSWALKTRLKIPLLYGIDAVHGHNNVDGAVIFPHNIGLGATRDPALVEKAAHVVAARSGGHGHSLGFRAVRGRGAQ